MNWKLTIAEIQRHGKMTQAQIAVRVGCGQATINDLATGSTKQPNYALGCALIKILDDLLEIAAQPATETVATQGI